jgi:hypothetical protein
MVDPPDKDDAVVAPTTAACTSTSSSSLGGMSVPPTQIAGQVNNMASSTDYSDATITCAASASTPTSSSGSDGAVASAMQTAVAHSPLWKLPPELRNMIYEFVVGADRVVYMDTGIPEPSLLLVSRLVRHESMPIYYQQNTFHQRQDNYKMAAIHCIYRKAKLILEQYNFDVGLYNIIDKEPNWCDVLEYSKAIHARTAQVYPDMHDDNLHTVNTDELLVRSMFEMVYEMVDLPWSTVENMLKKQRHVLVRLDSRWGDDG